jgi:hypothetical protein
LEEKKEEKEEEQEPWAEEVFGTCEQQKEEEEAVAAGGSWPPRPALNTCTSCTDEHIPSQKPTKQNHTKTNTHMQSTRDEQKEAKKNFLSNFWYRQNGDHPYEI